MNRISFAILLLLVPASGCATNAHTRGVTVQHVLVCWLKTPGDTVARERLITEARGFLGKIPGLRAVSAGTVLPSDRPAVDSSFDVAVIMSFDDETALAAYSHHPLHLNAIDRTLKPLVARYIVYDFTVAK